MQENDDTKRMQTMHLNNGALAALEQLGDAANRCADKTAESSWALQEAAFGYAIAILAAANVDDNGTPYTLTAYLNTLVKARGRMLPDTRKSYREGLAISEERCAATMFHMRLSLSRDGRERGLWFHLQDRSEQRAATYRTWLDGAAEACTRMTVLEGGNAEGMRKFTLWMLLNSTVGNLLRSVVDEAALLEWPAIKRVHARLGKEIEAHEGAKPKRRVVKKKTKARK